LGFSFIAVLFQDVVGGSPGGGDAVSYAAVLDNPSYPIVADESLQVFDATTYDGRALPGKCVLTPEMEMLMCTSGHGNEELYDAIRTHAGLR
jgi:hypothetical protein